MKLKSVKKWGLLGMAIATVGCSTTVAPTDTPELISEAPVEASKSHELRALISGNTFSNESLAVTFKPDGTGTLLSNNKSRRSRIKWTEKDGIATILRTPPFPKQPSWRVLVSKMNDTNIYYRQSGEKPPARILEKKE